MTLQEHENLNFNLPENDEDFEDQDDGHGLGYIAKSSRSKTQSKHQKRSSKKSNYDRKFSKLDHYN